MCCLDSKIDSKHRTMNYCSSLVSIIFLLSFSEQSHGRERIGACELCKEIVTAIDDFLTDGSTEQEIIDAITGVGSNLINERNKLGLNCAKLMASLNFSSLAHCSSILASVFFICPETSPVLFFSICQYKKIAKTSRTKIRAIFDFWPFKSFWQK